MESEPKGMVSEIEELERELEMLYAHEAFL